MKLTKLTTALAALTLSVCSASLSAAEVDEAIKSQQQLWANASYQLKGDAQDRAFERLLTDSIKALAEHPDSAEVYAWSGIIKSTYASIKGGLGGLSLVKSAKEDFERAIELDDKVLGGTTYASLGVLYHKVPGWPVGFGDDDKAQEMFQKAIAIDPNARESNFFYAEFLYDEGKYVEAKGHLLTAKAVSDEQWQERPIAYKHRQAQINAMLEKVDERLAKRSKKRR